MERAFYKRRTIGWVLALGLTLTACKPDFKPRQPARSFVEMDGVFRLTGADTPYTGILRNCYPDGTVSSQGAYYLGIKIDKWTTYYPDGKLEYETYYDSSGNMTFKRGYAPEEEE